MDTTTPLLRADKPGPSTFVAASHRYEAALRAVERTEEGDPNVDATLAAHEEARAAVLSMLVNRVEADLERCGNTDARDGTTYVKSVYLNGTHQSVDYTLRALLLETFDSFLD